MNILEVFDYNQHFVAMMNIINAARLNPPESGHKHHIVPKCWFKLHNLPVDNSKDNLVLLSYEDHIKVHKLSILCAATPEMKSKMGFAVHRLLKGQFSGMKHTVISRQIMSQKARQRNPDCYKGRIMSEDTKRKISESNKGKTTWNKGKHYKLSNCGRTGKPHPHKGPKCRHWRIVNGKREWY